eukprot:PITA_23671
MIKKATEQDTAYQQIKQQAQHSTNKENRQGYAMDVAGMLYYKKRLYVPNQNNVKSLILDEFHKIHYAGHPGYQKMILRSEKNIIGWVNQVVEDMLRAYVIKQPTKWEDYLHFVEFTYNNGYHTSLQMSPFEVLYKRKCHTPSRWGGPEDRLMLGPEMLKEMEEMVKKVWPNLKAA